MSESDPFVLAAPQTTDGSPNGDAGGRARAVASGFRCPGWIGAAAESGGVAWRRGAESDFIVCRCRCRSGKDTQSSCAGSLDGSASCDCSAVLPLRGCPARRSFGGRTGCDERTTRRSFGAMSSFLTAQPSCPWPSRNAVVGKSSGALLSCRSLSRCPERTAGAVTFPVTWCSGRVGRRSRAAEGGSVAVPYPVSP